MFLLHPRGFRRAVSAFSLSRRNPPVSPSTLRLKPTKTDISRSDLSRLNIINNQTVSKSANRGKPPQNQPRALNLFMLR
jgi:hypothetical protein